MQFNICLLIRASTDWMCVTERMRETIQREKSVFLRFVIEAIVQIRRPEIYSEILNVEKVRSQLTYELIAKLQCISDTHMSLFLAFLYIYTHVFPTVATIYFMSDCVRSRTCRKAKTRGGAQVNHVCTTCVYFCIKNDNGEKQSLTRLFVNIFCIYFLNIRNI